MHKLNIERWQLKIASHLITIIIVLYLMHRTFLWVLLYPQYPFSCSLLKVSSLKTSTGRKREHRVLLMVITMVVCYLLCWLPYGIMALVATFGEPGLVTAEASIMPSLLAKTSTVINPVIYIFMNKQVRTGFRVDWGLYICTFQGPRNVPPCQIS